MSNVPRRSSNEILAALRAYCHESSESFYTISRKIGVSYTSLSRWVLHGVTPTPASLRKIRMFIRKYGKKYL
jgi:hypothetical protein